MIDPIHFFNSSNNNCFDGINNNVLNNVQKSLFSNPSDLQGLSLWLDASDTSTITHSSNAVSTWADKSGGGYDATQTTSDSRPTTNTATFNGKNVLSFDGINDHLRLGNAGNWANAPFTYYSVFESDSTSNQHIFCGHVGGSPNSRIYIFTFGGQKVGVNNGTGFEQLQTIEDTALIVGLVYDGTNDLILRINGTNYTSSGITGSDQNITNHYVIGREDGAGGRNYFSGKFMEQQVYDIALANSDLAKIDRYLSNKWGIDI